MNISSIIPESTIDYPKKLGPVIFTQGCNLRCGFCQNSSLAPTDNLGLIKDFSKYENNWKAKTKHGWYDGATISGGEPTLHSDLEQIIEELREIGFSSIKLDTNGTNPKRLAQILPKVDYVAMDIKGPKELYPIITSKDQDYSKEVQESMNILKDSGKDYELRTTCCPLITPATDNNLRWMAAPEIKAMSQWILENSAPNVKYFLQKFQARSKEEMIDPTFSKENLPREYQETTDEYLSKVLGDVRTYLPEAKIRDLDI